MLAKGATELIQRAYVLNAHPALTGKDRVTRLWYVSLLEVELAVGEMELAVEASGIPLESPEERDRKAREYRIEMVQSELEALEYKPLGVNIAYLRGELNAELQQLRNGN